jgi:hypothetical protein
MYAHSCDVSNNCCSSLTAVAAAADAIPVTTCQQCMLRLLLLLLLLVPSCMPACHSVSCQQCTAVNSIARTALPTTLLTQQQQQQQHKLITHRSHNILHPAAAAAAAAAAVAAAAAAAAPAVAAAAAAAAAKPALTALTTSFTLLPLRLPYCTPATKPLRVSTMQYSVVIGRMQKGVPVATAGKDCAAGCKEGSAEAVVGETACILLYAAADFGLNTLR